MKIKSPIQTVAAIIALSAFAGPVFAGTPVDNQPPVVSVKHITIGLNINGQASISPEDLGNGTSDSAGEVSLSINVSSFDASSLGENKVLLTAVDENGNQSCDTAIVTVIDTFAPVVLTKPVTLYIGKEGKATVSAEEFNNGSYDNSSSVTLKPGQTEFDCSQVGLHPVWITAVDASGNFRTAKEWVTVIDAVSPTVKVHDIIVLLNENGMATIVPGDVDDGSYDQCGIRSIELDKSDFDPTDIGKNTVHLKVTDMYGNFSIASATVTVLPDIHKSTGNNKTETTNTNP